MIFSIRVVGEKEICLPAAGRHHRGAKKCIGDDQKINRFTFVG